VLRVRRCRGLRRVVELDDRVAASPAASSATGSTQSEPVRPLLAPCFVELDGLVLCVDELVLWVDALAPDVLARCLLLRTTTSSDEFAPPETTPLVGEAALRARVVVSFQVSSSKRPG
jgi:hypothetical protein